MRYPAIEIDLKKLQDNAKRLMSFCEEKGIEPVAITKVFCGDIRAVNSLLKGGVKIIGDSRLENFINYKELPCEKLLVRIPMLSEIKEVVEYCDISLNSETATLEALSEAALARGIKHRVILMVELGDLREGFLPEDIPMAVEKVNDLQGLILEGIGANLTCYGGVLPDEANLSILTKLKSLLQDNIGVKVNMVSGGNSSSLHLIFKDKMPGGINSIRLGEALILARETAYGKKVDGLHDDAFILKGEIIEIKEKNSVPSGTVGRDAFGRVPKFEDKGIIKRAIIALGRQDVHPEDLVPIEEGLEILGASSDHMLLELTSKAGDYKIGDIVSFSLNYVALLNVMNSPYVHKEYR
ncbi:alanine/ornithine racemase family PLP-dependent enzyme [Alloiococcus sp. CFN-8]|uniref:alanine/ornithine racemase family PLP-dependent enzyme n=1 Tax=Alloiococcus sp. CFN-8 TaxID=3416081 RepID=UPI003CFAD53C